MVLHIIHADILLIARIFPRPSGARKNTTQLAKYPRVLYVKPSNKIYLFTYHMAAHDLLVTQHLFKLKYCRPMQKLELYFKIISK